MPLDYRQVQGPEQLDTNLPDSGASARAQALSRTFKEFTDVAANEGSKFSAEAGKQAGAAAGASGDPNYRTGWNQFSAYNTAYNNAATGQYAIESQAHADDLAERLRVEANNDPAAFQATYSAARDATLKNAPPMARAALTEIYNRNLAAGMSSISFAQATEQRNTAISSYNFGVERQTSRLAKIMSSDNPEDQALVEQEHGNLMGIIQGGVIAGIYSPAEAALKNVVAMKEATGQSFELRFDTALLNSSFGNREGVNTVLDNFTRAHQENLADTNNPVAFSEPEYNQLMSVAKQKLAQQNLADANNQKDGKTAEKAKYEQGAINLTVAMGNGTVTAAMVTRMVANREVESSVGRSVLATLKSSGGDSPPNERALAVLKADPETLKLSPAEVLKLGSINAKQQMELTSWIGTQNNGWESHPAIKDARADIAAELKKKAGGLSYQFMSDDQQREYDRTGVQFTTQMNALPVDQRDKEAPRIANNVILDSKAQDAKISAQRYENGRASLDRTYGPNGTNFKSNEDYAARVKDLDANVKKYNDQADEFRKGIK